MVFVILGFSGALWGSLGLPGALWGSLGLSGALWGFLGLSGALWGSLGLSGALWGSLGFSGALFAKQILSLFAVDALSLLLVGTGWTADSVAICGGCALFAACGCGLESRFRSLVIGSVLYTMVFLSFL